MEENGNRFPIIESLILSSPEPLEPGKITAVVDGLKPSEIDEIVDKLNQKYRDTDSSFRIRKIAGGYQMYITENYAGFVTELFTRRKNQRLTRAALETLSIVAYRQPVTRADIELIRGVSSDSALKTLLERKLITLTGRAQTIGRPLLYGTTDEFLKFFSLDSLNDLPRMEEIEEILSAADADTQPSFSFDNGNNDAEQEGESDASGQPQEIPVSIENDQGDDNPDGDTMTDTAPFDESVPNSEAEEMEEEEEETFKS